MIDSPSYPNLCVENLRLHLQNEGAQKLRDVLRRQLERVAGYKDSSVWIHRIADDQILAQFEAATKRLEAGESLPLFGVPFAVKDNIDVAGIPTTAACPAFSYVPDVSAPAVDRLREAGAILFGKTNLDQFATGLAGDRSPYGICRNPFDGNLIAGGSSSGSAVAVAAGLVSFALGTDTAGSGRVPAGCTNIVGLKPTPGALSTEGVVPACQSLDCISIFALTVEDAWEVFEIARGSRIPRCVPSAPAKIAFAPPMSLGEFFGDVGQAGLFESALSRMREIGWQQAAVDFSPFLQVGALLYDGPWLAERWAAVGDFIEKNGPAIHPVTRSIINGGAAYSAKDVFRAQYRLAELRSRCLDAFAAVDFLVVPTVPTVPSIADVQADSLGWSRRLGRYTSFVNLLGLAALALPAGFTPQGIPGGVTLIGPAGSDRRLAALGAAWQQCTGLQLGATGHRKPATVRRGDGSTVSSPIPAGPAPGHVHVAVAGAHLRGQPLHPDLLKMGTRLVRAARTDAVYRFMALMHLKPPRPGLVRDEDRGSSIDVEIYELPLAGFGALVASVAPPLAIGTVDLDDGTSVKGFLCESWAARQARDITNFGGWVAFLEYQETVRQP